MAIDGSRAGGGDSDFAHLHLHTQYSLLDGAIRMKDLAPRVRERGMTSVAVTDHGNMFGALQLWQQAKEHGVKPIFGCEAYLSEGDAKAKTDRKNYHIVLLAENETGFRNLQRLVSYGHIEGFYYNPRIDRQALREHREGLIGLSACLGGHISRLIGAGDMDGAKERVREYADIFEPGNYFLELQPNGLPAQEQVNASLAQLGRDLGVPTVATNDCHYVDRHEAHAHEILMCMGMGRTITDPKRVRHDCDEFFLKTPAEVERYFSGRYPEAFANACEIARRCNVELKLGQTHLPTFELPPGVEDDIPTHLRKIAREGLTRRLDEQRRRGTVIDEAVYRARLEYELDVIVQMDFPGYFLIVWDFIRHAKSIGVPVGPGRGSGAGSLVAWAMRITDLDPIRYDLLFERFLNPERVSMPDFDIDFCMDRRDEVIRYVTERYGAERVGQIATFHTLKARGLVRDVCRVMGMTPGEANEIAKLVPEGPKVSLSLAMTDPAPLKAQAAADPEMAKKLADAINIADASYKLRERIETDAKCREVLEVGRSLEGLNRHAGMHAAGIVIGNHALWEHVPCFAADGKIVTQYTMTDAELAGLVKFDFLGLKTLTVIATAVREIERVSKTPFDLEGLPMDDAGVFGMISRGETTGVFQLESSGFRDLLQKLRPDCFEDIVAAVALYRPGPLEGGMVDQFIACKHGKRRVEYPHPLLEQVLKETYGVFVYQEQVMQAAQILAGYSLGGADLMRRAMGKKKQSEMDKQRSMFVDGCAKTHGIAKKTAVEIFDLIDKFAGYGFNKSHSAAYGLITYQTAYLKHHHPVAFMAALMTCDKDRIENVVKFIAEARAMGIDVLGPCVNESSADFGVVESPRRGSAPNDADAPEPACTGSLAIRFGLGAVRNVGGSAVDAILEARGSEGPFTSIFELCRRVDSKRVNKRALESLVVAGALEQIAAGHSRAELVAAIEPAVEQGQSAQRDRNSNQVGLFDMLGAAAVETTWVETYPPTEIWSAREQLAKEREALGFYLTGHPLDRYRHDVERLATTSISRLTPELNGREVRLAGLVLEFREVMTRAGKPMGFFQLEDALGRIECVVFPRTFATAVHDGDEETLGRLLSRWTDEPVIVDGKVEATTTEATDEESSATTTYKLMVDRVTPLAEARRSSARELLVELAAEQLTSQAIEGLERVVRRHPGVCPLRLRVRDEDRFRADVLLGDAFRVSADDDVVSALEQLFDGAQARFC